MSTLFPKLRKVKLNVFTDKVKAYNLAIANSIMKEKSGKFYNSFFNGNGENTVEKDTLHMRKVVFTSFLE